MALWGADCQGHADTSTTRGGAAYREPAAYCFRCSSIDFEEIFNYDLWGAALKLRDLGQLEAQAELSSCPLCRLFRAARIQEDDISPSDHFTLYLSPPPRPYRESEGLVLTVARAFGAKQDPVTFTEDIRRRMETSSGFITYSEASETGPHRHALRGRSIDAGAIDFDILRGWVQDCVRVHSYDCIQIESSGSIIRQMKLIDCERRQIVPALTTYEYCALSYVWGTKRSGNDRCVHDRLPTNLPQTIEDAIKVTKELGLRYLWIDRYCINQDNDAEKQIQIQQMDLIYQKAFVTIIAAAGTDPYFGLPGVNTTSRIPQATAWINGRCLVSVPPDPQLPIKASKWMQRAWTYQENFFSTRRIVFTEQQVFYECRSGTRHETVAVFDRSFVTRFLNPDPSDGHKPSSICDRLKEYCGRDLSVDSDAIRAFEGVFQNYRRKNDVHQYLGIPIMPLSTKRRPEYKHRSRGEAFAAGLSWCSKAPGTRRSLFPTWSWAGWTTSIDYRGYLCNDGLKLGDERPLKVFIESCDGSLSDMDDLSNVLPDQGNFGSPSKFIHIEAWTIPIDVWYITNGAEKPQYNNYWYPKGTGKPQYEDYWYPKPQDRHYHYPKGVQNVQHYSHWYDDGSGYLARFQSDEGAVHVPMYPLYQKHVNNVTAQHIYASGFEQGSLLGIVLGRYEDFSHLGWLDTIFIMVVHKKEHHYERVGHILFTQDYERMSDDSDEILETAKRELQTIFRSKERRTIRLG